MSKTLAEAAAELWKERMEVIIKLEQLTPVEGEPDSRDRGMALPADQPKKRILLANPTSGRHNHHKDNVRNKSAGNYA